MKASSLTFDGAKMEHGLRVHDLRATFVTLSLAAGRSEAWVADRTGHKSSVVLNRYRWQTRQVAELELGSVALPDAALDAARPQKQGGGGPEGGPPRGPSSSKPAPRGDEIEPYY
jgi:hypothetical protein